MTTFYRNNDISIAIATDESIAGANDITVHLCRERFDISAPLLSLSDPADVVINTANQFTINLTATQTAALKGIYYLYAVVTDSVNKKGTVAIDPRLIEFID